MLTKEFLFIGMVIYGVYDFGVFVFSGVSTTISQVMTDYLKMSPFGAYAFGMLMGHFLWPMSTSVKVWKKLAAGLQHLRNKKGNKWA